MKLAHFIGAINSRIILGFIYFLLFVPISLILRTLGKDPMQSQFDKKLTTYKIKPEKNDLIERMEKPF
mgnify:FL=1